MGAVSKEAQLSIAASSMFPGFRFSPTDEELISYYLKNKLEGPEPGKSVEVIPEVDICNFEPWDLPAKSVIQSDNEWFFFSPRGRKYPNGSQSRRATEFSYWKATGKERNVKSSSNVIGTKRTLVFHMGRAPKGERTEWIMHEYCMNDKSQDSIVVCRLRKNSDFRLNDTTNGGSSSRSPLSTVHNSENAVSEVGIDHDKPVECYSKKSTSSHDSHSTEQIDSASESNQKQTTEVTQAESSGHQMDSYDDDFYADILNDDIIRLDEASASASADILPVLANKSEAEQNSHQPMQAICNSEAIPFQGTANRRIHLRKRKEKFPAESLEGPNSQESPKTSADRMDDQHMLLYVIIIILVLLALFLSKFCFTDNAGSVSFLVGRFLSSQKHHK
ncbi:NAC domain-containing protein 40-like [Prunus avium]|uniref:NAC domain-containing protein 40-like n=1 Tax=Prunus avium TaxID=42229 RepID=A0A6P5S1K3_PRUAV|nr:NAC domain-containing protein 40-like [Prunus avium]XP_021808538.1 NAC domain-containing protein 40-like [Prunus avium]XP_021808539.1 NAC domain-containing protein 40-like [Prunus avium]